MSNKENLMGIITDILKEIPLSAVLREKILALEDKMSVLESENLVLKTENQKLKVENLKLKEKIQTLEKFISIQNIPLHEFDFIDPPGYYTHPKYPNQKICPACLIKDKLISPVSEIDKNAWYCTVCKQPLSGSKGEVFTVNW
jgi:hypothetical protein